MLIDLVQLRTFVAVAEEQHLTRAADRLHISISAASAHVRAVEETLGAQLFVRTNRNLELTQVGQFLLGKARALLSEAALFTSYAREARREVEGTLIVGSDTGPVASQIGKVVSAVRIQHPLLRVELRARPTVNSHHGLKAAELDLCLLLEHPSDDSLTYYQITTVPFTVAGPVAWKDQIDNADWAGLARLPWIAPVDNSPSYSAMLQQMFDTRGFKLDVVARFDSPVLGRAMVEAGVGLMLMRQELVTPGLEQGLLALSPIARTEFPLFLAHLATRRDDPLIRAFLQGAATVWPAMRPLAVQQPGHKP